MPIYIGDVEQKRIGTGLVPFSTEDVPASFPIALWGLQASRYLDYWNQFTGQIWNETIPNSDPNDQGKPKLKFPLQINYLKSICMKHSYVLFGEVQDGPWPLVPIRCKAAKDYAESGDDDEMQADQKFAKDIQNFVNRVWMQNDGRAIQQEAGLVQQFLGGTVFKLSWTPGDPDLPYGIRVEHVLPDFFLPVWDGGKFNNLLEAWIVYRIPAREAALRFGYDVVSPVEPLYIEHWTKDKINITVAGKPLTYKVDGVNITYDNIENPFGFVPFVYIPRERAGGYYGLSILDDLLGLVKELNARIADMGDVVQETAHRDLIIRNTSQAPKSQDIGATRPAINIGVAAPGSDKEPDVFAIDPPQVGEALAHYPEFLRQQLSRDSSVPSVADGEDEGSQRSALTLAFRMFPLTSKIRAVRTYWTVGLIRLAKMMVKMAIIKKDEKEIPDFLKSMEIEEIEEIDWALDWSPMIPRDKEQELNEIVMSIQSQMLSPVSGLAQLNLVDDPEQEYKLVQQHVQWLTALQTAASMAGKAGNQNDSAAGGSVAPPKAAPVMPIAETLMTEPKG